MSQRHISVGALISIQERGAAVVPLKKRLSTGRQPIVNRLSCFSFRSTLDVIRSRFRGNVQDDGLRCYAPLRNRRRDGVPAAPLSDPPQSRPDFPPRPAARPFRSPPRVAPLVESARCTARVLHSINRNDRWRRFLYESSRIRYSNRLKQTNTAILNLLGWMKKWRSPLFTATPPYELLSCLQRGRFSDRASYLSNTKSKHFTSKCGGADNRLAKRMKRAYKTKWRRSTGQQPGMNSGRRPFDKPLINRLSIGYRVARFGIHRISSVRAFEGTSWTVVFGVLR